MPTFGRISSVTVERIGLPNQARATSVVVEGVAALPWMPGSVTQVTVESIRTYETTPLHVTQVTTEAISSKIQTGSKPTGVSYGGVGSVATPSMPTKYRILVWDTNDNLVAVFTSVRAFDFIDSVNGGSAAGWFRISTDTTTLLGGDTAGTTYAGQYSKRYLSGLNAITITLTQVGPSYQVSFSGNCGAQTIYINIDDTYRISCNIPALQSNGAVQTPASVAALVSTRVINYLNGISPNPYTVAYTPGNSYFQINGASQTSQQGSPPPNTSAVTYMSQGRQYYYVGVIGVTKFIMPGSGEAGAGGTPTPPGVVMGGLSTVAAAAYQQAFQYNYRVQFFLEDSINPWYDGRINGWTPQTPDTSTDDSYVTVYTEGWQNALDDGIVTETLNPGLQPNGVNNGEITADKYLHHLIETYQDSKRFNKPYIASVNVDLFQMQFQGEGLGKCINDVITQVVNNTGHTFEWWVRGLKNVGQGKSLAVVVQPNLDPHITPTGKIAPTTYSLNTYYVYEVRGKTVFNYQVQNTIINLYNMIALYGGRDPSTQQQVYGAYEDSISIALYGVRQQRVTNDNLLTQQTLNNYAIAYLLLNGYPQPQTTYYKYVPTDAMRAGVWVQVLEPGTGTVIGQNLHQMRAIQVECSLQEDQEKMDQIVTAAAPRPFIDHAYYGAIQQSKNTIPVVINRGGTVNPNTYMVNGGDWTGQAKGPTHPVKLFISNPLGHFGKAKIGTDGTTPKLPLVISIPVSPKSTDPDYSPQYPDLVTQLQDSVTGKTGDGAYELDFVTDINAFNPSAPHGQGILVTALGGASSVGSSLTSGNVQQVPSSPNMLRLWQFIVLNGAVAGAVDMRTYYGQYTGVPPDANTIYVTVPAGATGHFLYNKTNPGKGNIWFCDLQVGSVGLMPVLWLGKTVGATTTVYNGDMSFFASLSGTVIELSQFPPQIGSPHGLTNYPYKHILNMPRSVSFPSLPKFKKNTPKVIEGKTEPFGGNIDFPGGQGALQSFFFPRLEIPTVLLNYIPYKCTLTITCTNGNTFSQDFYFYIWLKPSA